MANKRRVRQHPPKLKARIALDALREDMTLAQIASKHGVHPSLVSKYKVQLLDRLPEIFATPKASDTDSQEELIASLFEKIGRLEVELDWLKKKSERLR